MGVGEEAQSLARDERLIRRHVALPVNIPHHAFDAVGIALADDGINSLRLTPSLRAVSGLHDKDVPTAM